MVPRNYSAARLVACAFAAFLIAFAVIVWNVDSNSVGSSYLDPIAPLRTQDEAVHIHSAIRMARCGGWLTPVFMGRLFLFKPPLLIWLSAVSIRIFGLSLISARLPVLLSGAIGVAAV